MVQLCLYIIIINKTLKYIFESQMFIVDFWTPLYDSYITFKTLHPCVPTRGQKKTWYKHRNCTKPILVIVVTWTGALLLYVNYVSYHICLFLLHPFASIESLFSFVLYICFSVRPWESAEDTCWEQVWWRTEETSSYRTGK